MCSRKEDAALRYRCRTPSPNENIAPNLPRRPGESTGLPKKSSLIRAFGLFTSRNVLGSFTPLNGASSRSTADGGRCEAIPWPCTERYSSPVLLRQARSDRDASGYSQGSFGCAIVSPN